MCCLHNKNLKLGLSQVQYRLTQGKKPQPSIAYSIVLAQNRTERAGTPLTEFLDEQSEHTQQARTIL